MPSNTGTASLLHEEIFQQPALWPLTAAHAHNFITKNPWIAAANPVVITGAGTSAYASAAIAAAWPGAVAIPTTDLLTEAAPFVSDGLLVSLARSGDSPESAAVVERVRRVFPQVRHLAITCNADGYLAKTAGLEVLLLDPRTNDKSLAMTGSFSNLVLAGLCLQQPAALLSQIDAVSANCSALLPIWDEQARTVSQTVPSRVVALGSPPLFAAAREAALKITELSNGEIIATTETFLGLRHGPMAALRADTLVLCFLSSDSARRRYEDDLLRELRSKTLGRIVAIAGANSPDLFDVHIFAAAPQLNDKQRTPFELVFPQLLAYHLSIACKLNPDRPSPAGVISRVVQGVTIYSDAEV